MKKFVKFAIAAAVVTGAAMAVKAYLGGCDDSDFDDFDDYDDDDDTAEFDDDLDEEDPEEK